MASRSRLICWLLVLLAGLVMATYVRAWASVGTPLDRTSDFAGSYIAATLWRDGHADRVYDAPSEIAALRAAGAPTGHDYIPFVNPPAAILLALPTTGLDGGDAWRLWSMCQLGLLLAGVVVAGRAAGWPRRSAPLPLAAAAIAVAGTGTGLLFLEGQWDGLSVLGLAVAYALWRRDRSFAGGLALALGAGVAKPHLALGLAAFVLGRRQWRAVAGAAVGGLVLLAASLAVVGPGGIGAYLAELSRPVNSPVREMLGLSGLFGSWLGPGRANDLLTLGFGCAGLALAGLLGERVRRRPDLLDPGLAGATVLSLLVAPHLLVHDLSVLAPMLVIVLAWRGRQVWPRWPDTVTGLVITGWVLLSLAARVDLGKDEPAPPGRLVPWVLIALAAGAVAAVIRPAGLRPLAGRSPTAVAAEASG